MDEVFGAENFRAEIIWKRTSGHADAHDFGPQHDVIACYAKSKARIWNPQFEPYDDDFIKRYYRYDDGDGRLYWPGDITAPNIRKGDSGKPWRGFDPTTRGRSWGVPYSSLDELDRQGRLYWPKRGSGFPTRRLVAAGVVVGVQLLAHVVLAPDGQWDCMAA